MSIMNFKQILKVFKSYVFKYLIIIKNKFDNMKTFIAIALTLALTYGRDFEARQEEPTYTYTSDYTYDNSYTSNYDRSYDRYDNDYSYDYSGSTRRNEPWTDAEW